MWGMAAGVADSMTTVRTSVQMVWVGPEVGIGDDTVCCSYVAETTRTPAMRSISTTTADMGT